jgi:hypothetical protein
MNDVIEHRPVKLFDSAMKTTFMSSQSQVPHPMYVRLNKLRWQCPEVGSPRDKLDIVQ